VDQARPATLFAHRVYTCVIDGSTVEVNASVFVPVEEDKGHYGCHYRLSISADSIERTIYGVDTLQALHLALCMMRVDLLLLDGASDWRFRGGSGLELPTQADLNPS